MRGLWLSVVSNLHPTILNGTNLLSVQSSKFESILWGIPKNITCNDYEFFEILFVSQVIPAGHLLSKKEVSGDTSKYDCFDWSYCLFYVRRSFLSGWHNQRWIWLRSGPPTGYLPQCPEDFQVDSGDLDASCCLMWKLKWSHFVNRRRKWKCNFPLSNSSSESGCTFK